MRRLASDHDSAEGFPIPGEGPLLAQVFRTRTEQALTVALQAFA